MEVNDKVRFHTGDGRVLVTGKVVGITIGEVLVEEESASSVWGESTEKAGTLHKVHPRELEVVDA
jgi:hypothetical protein